jgi:hypothetical protein
MVAPGFNHTPISGSFPDVCNALPLWQPSLSGEAILSAGSLSFGNATPFENLPACAPGFRCRIATDDYEYPFFYSTKILEFPTSINFSPTDFLMTMFSIYPFFFTNRGLSFAKVGFLTTVEVNSPESKLGLSLRISHETRLRFPV